MTTHDATPLPLAPKGSTGFTVLRRVGAVLLLGLAAVILFSVGMLQTVNAIAGKPGQVIDTGLSIITSPGSAKALSTQLITKLQQDAGDDTRLAFTEHKDELTAAVGKVIQDKEVRAMARADLLLAYDAINTGKKTTIDLKPLLQKLTAALHRVDPRIPDVPKDLKNTTVTIDKKVEGLNLVDQLTLSIWIAAVIGFAMAILTARFLVRNRLRRVLAVAFATFAPTIMLLSLAASIDNISLSLASQDHEIAVLATALAKHVGGVLLATALVLLGISVVTLAAFLLANLRASRLPSSQVLPPQAAVAAGVPGAIEVQTGLGQDVQVGPAGVDLPPPPPPLPPAPAPPSGSGAQN